MILIEHLPSYAPRHVPHTFEVEDTSEALALPFIARWLTHPRFHRYTQDPVPPGWALIVELDWGFLWHTIAYADRPLDPLPHFRPRTPR